MCNPTPVLRHAAKAAAAAADAQTPAGTKGGAAELEEKDAKSEDRPRFDGPEPIHPCTKRHHVHHFLVWSAVAALLVYDGFFWSLPLTAFMVWYGDAYTAVLHCALDRPACLDIKILTGAARGFQAHHEYPLASTHGRGLYRMICDTQRIQLITIGAAVVFGRWNLMTARLVLMKLVTSAYGGATGHFYAHGGGKGRGPVIRTMQKLHLLLPPKHHVGGHHVAPHDKNFGIVNGLSNYFLNPLLWSNSPPLWVCLASWAFLSLFDVAIIERCVEPASTLAASAGVALLGAMRVAVAA